MGIKGVVGMITFRKYYIQQFKEVPIVWKLARKHKKYLGFVLTFFTLFNPAVIYTMYLYDTGKIQVDKRFREKE